MARSQITGLVIRNIGIAQLQVVEAHCWGIEVGASMPGPHMELDEAVAGNSKGQDLIGIGSIGITGGSHSHEPGLVSNGTQALGALLVAGDGVELSPPMFQGHDVEAGGACTELELGIVGAEASPIRTGKDDLTEGCKGFGCNGLGREGVLSRRRWHGTLGGDRSFNLKFCSYPVSLKAEVCSHKRGELPHFGRSIFVEGLSSAEPRHAIRIPPNSRWDKYSAWVSSSYKSGI